MKLVPDQSQRAAEKEILEGLGFTVIEMTPVPFSPFPSGEGRLAPEYCLGLVVKHQCKRRCLHRC